jgi:c-src tyrosine kinase
MEMPALSVDDDDDVVEEENAYDTIAGVVDPDKDGGHYQAVAAVADQYAKLEGGARAAVEGNYHRIPKVLESFSDEVPVLDSEDLMIDVSARVGHGSFGDIYRGVYRGVDIAVKMLKNEFTEDQLQTFYDEADVIARVPPHEFVVGFLGATPDPFTICTEFCGQGSLLKYLRRSSTNLPVGQALSIAKSVAAGMVHLAANNIVHRDLAARNILLTNDLTPKISDFGLSRTIEESGAEHHSKAGVGPIRWMAIESIRDAKYSEKSDVWAYSVIVWETLHRGAVPYGSKTSVMDVGRQVIKGRRLEFEALPPEIEFMLGSCTVKKPADRPTFADIFQIFEASSGDEVVYASLSTFSEMQQENADLSVFRDGDV